MCYFIHADIPRGNLKGIFIFKNVECGNVSCDDYENYES